jgi:hypothetical protein
MVIDGRDHVRAASTTTDLTLPAVRARDVVAFGCEVGRVLSDGRVVWQLHDEAARLRATCTRAQQRDADARAHQEQRDDRLAGWTAAVCEALTDTQLTAAIQRITSPVGGWTAALRQSRPANSSPKSRCCRRPTR